MVEIGKVFFGKYCPNCKKAFDMENQSMRCPLCKGDLQMKHMKYEQRKSPGPPKLVVVED